jgi:hypothetical protein
VRDFTIMQIQEVRRGIVCLQYRKIFRAKMRVFGFAGQDRKQKTQVGVVRIQ